MYRQDHVEVAFEKQRKTRWGLGINSTRGTEFIYSVTDYNYRNRRDWAFSVKVPTNWDRENYLGVGPISVPNRRAWAGLERRSIQFALATMPRFKSKAYAKLSISDVTGEKNRRVLTTESRKKLASWLCAFKPRAKKLVTTPDSRDKESLVALFDKDDHIAMIKFFIALKPWVLYKGYNPDEARIARRQRGIRLRQTAKTKPLKGLQISVTGKLGYGRRDQAYRWLERLGAVTTHNPSWKNDYLIVGAHYLGDNRIKVQEAMENHVRRISEASFRQKFGI